MKHFKLCLQFCCIHIKKYRKRIFAIFSIYFLVLLIITWIRSKEGCNGIDLFVLMNGGYSLETNNLLDMLIGIYPYLSIGYLCSMYLDEMLEKQATFVLIRMKNMRNFHLANIVTLSCFNVLVICCFQIVKFCISIFFTSNCQVESLYYMTDVRLDLNIISLQVYTLLYQIVGSLAVFLIQYMIQKKCGNGISGMLFVFAIYFININSNLLRNLELGTYVILGNLQVINNNGTSLQMFVSKNCLYIIVTAIFILMKRGKKNVRN